MKKGEKYVKKERKYVVPDPSKKTLTGDNIPVNINKKGEYNLNFIDWQNEFDQVYGNSDDDSDDCPIKGMDKDVFEAIMEEERQFDTQQLNGVQTQYYDKFPVKVAVKNS